MHQIGKELFFLTNFAVGACPTTLTFTDVAIDIVLAIATDTWIGGTFVNLYITHKKNVLHVCVPGVVWYDKIR